MGLYIGLMSGTSMDGIDAALVDTEKHHLIQGIMRPYSQEAKIFLNRVISNQTLPWHEIAQLNTILGREFALAAQQLLTQNAVNRNEIIAIGSHGQTVAHDTSVTIPYTMQLGCPHTIAVLTGMPVVADFRTRDLVLGGQGAPFAPIYHQAIFKTAKKPLAVVNLGGIANITYLTPEGGVSGYDLGPANCLLDDWVREKKGLNYDKNGAWAASGRVIERLLVALCQDSYFKLPPPKSIGKAYFSLDWLAPHLRADDKPEDIQATLLMLTAKCIVNALTISSLDCKYLAVCGGGVHNQTLMRAIEAQLPGVCVESTAAIGVDPDYLEAMMFAWLADQAIHKKTLDFRQITASREPAVFGVVY